jgi:hypothetical protein
VDEVLPEETLSWVAPARATQEVLDASRVVQNLGDVSVLDAGLASDDHPGLTADEYAWDSADRTDSVLPQQIHAGDTALADGFSPQPPGITFQRSTAKPAVVDLSHLDHTDTHGDIDTHLAAILGEDEHDIIEITAVKTKAPKDSRPPATDEVDLDFEIDLGDESLSFDDDLLHTTSSSAFAGNGLDVSSGFDTDNDELLSGLVEALESLESSTSFMTVSNARENDSRTNSEGERRNLSLSPESVVEITQTLRGVLSATAVSPEDIRQLCHLVADAYGIGWEAIEPESELIAVIEDEYTEDFSPVLQSLEEELDCQLGELLREGTSIYSSSGDDTDLLTLDDAASSPLLGDLAPPPPFEHDNVVFDALVLDDDLKKNLT